MNFNRNPILTTRGQLIINPTAIAKPGVGSVRLTGGGSGSIDTLTVNSVSIISGAVAFNTSLYQTAIDLANNINNYVSTPDYWAYVDDDTSQPTVYILQVTRATGTLTVASTVTTITKTDTNLSGGALGSGGDYLGFTETGIDITWNDEYLREPTEETGRTIAKVFFLGGTPRISVMLKQWDQDALKARFPGRFNWDSFQIQIPGTIVPGDPMTTYAVGIEFRPDSAVNPTMWARKAMLTGAQVVTSRFRTTEVRKLALEFDLIEDQAIGGVTAAAAIGPANGISIT